MKKDKRLIRTLLITAASMAILQATPAFSSSIERVSIDHNGNQLIYGGIAESAHSAISKDGQVSFFFSAGDNVVPGLPNNLDTHLFIRDRKTSTTKIAGISHTGEIVKIPLWTSASISDDGRYIAFTGMDSQNEFKKYAYARDIEGGVTELISIDMDGNIVPSGGIISISGNGRYIIYSSGSDNIVENDTNGKSDTFLYDRELKLTTRINVDSNGNQSIDGAGPIAISSDGRFILFYSNAYDLVDNDTNGVGDYFIRDKLLGTTIRATVDENGFEFPEAASIFSSADISDNGQYVVFEYQHKVYLFDSVTKTSQAIVETTQVDQINAYPRISGNGKYITFTSSSIITPGDGNNKNDVFQYEISTGNFKRISQSPNGDDANSYSTAASMSADGKYIVFASYASNLIEGDTNKKMDSFVYEAAEPMLSLSPPSGRYITNQKIDLIMILDNPESKAVTSISLVWNGTDISVPFENCSIMGNLEIGGTTWNCQNLNVGQVFSSGQNNITATIILEDNTVLTDHALWDVVH